VTSAPENIGVIGLRVPSALAYRHLAIRVVSTACKMALGDDGSGASPSGESDFEAEVVSAVGEAFNNIAVHGFRELAPRSVQIEVDWNDERLTVVMIDEGRTFDPSQITPPDLEALPERGMGLFIMQTCMDEIDYRPGPPNVLRMHKLRRREALLPSLPNADPASGEIRVAGLAPDEPEERGSGVDLITPAMPGCTVAVESSRRR
jgi:serine/threonine-protein kinase RsbW